LHLHTKKDGPTHIRKSHVNPFYLKEEFAPSDKAMLLKRQQDVHNLIAPHLRILQFLASHFNATRLASIHTQRLFYRLAIVTLEGLKTSKAHPLAREMHFQAVLFGLNVLRHSTGLDQAAQWRLKDTILSGALAWFSHQPR
jgi:phosphatidylinositol 4-kinase